MQLAEVTVQTFESLKRSGKLARHFVDIVEEVGSCVLFRVHDIGAWALLALQRSL